MTCWGGRFCALTMSKSTRCPYPSLITSEGNKKHVSEKDDDVFSCLLGSSRCFVPLRFLESGCGRAAGRTAAAASPQLPAAAWLTSAHLEDTRLLAPHGSPRRCRKEVVLRSERTHGFLTNQKKKVLIQWAISRHLCLYQPLWNKTLVSCSANIFSC